MTHIVKAAAAVAHVAGTDLYIYQGAPLPEGVENLDHLIACDLVIEVEEVEVLGEVTDEVITPETAGVVENADGSQSVGEVTEVSAEVEEPKTARSRASK